MNPSTGLTPEQAGALLRLLRSRQLVATDAEAESIVHALTDIAVSVNRIYAEFLPRLMADESDREDSTSLLWDIREEFRHIDYHIHDAQLLDL